MLSAAKLPEVEAGSAQLDSELHMPQHLPYAKRLLHHSHNGSITSAHTTIALFMPPQTIVALQHIGHLQIKAGSSP